MVNKGEYLLVKEHSLEKYRILEKYIDACMHFQRKYKNFAYIDTHGGSGKVIFEDNFKDGSILIAARIPEGFPCYVVEIDPNRYKCLKDSIEAFSNVNILSGDCNEKIDDILKEIPQWKFTLCVIDPDGLIYTRNGFSCCELSWETIEKIAQHPKTELILNFQVNAIKRLKGYIQKRPDDQLSQKYERAITDLYGSDVVWKEKMLNERGLLEAFVEERLGQYNYVGAILVRVNKAPFYYLVFASKKDIGAKIMRDIMRKEWGQKTLADFDEVFPINHFVFE